MAASKFVEKRFLAEVLGEVYETVERREKEIHQDYRQVGFEEEQAKDWRTGELLWEDEEKTVPMYRAKYGYVDKEDSELSDEDKAKIKACQYIMKQLENML